MQPNHFETYAPIIRALSPHELADSSVLRRRLRIAVGGDLEVCYAPVEYINPNAKVVIVGITPGLTQMVNAVAECRRQLIQGAEKEATLRAAKLSGAFSGTMRPNLVELLDSVGLQTALGIRTCSELFSVASNLVQTASVLRNPVFFRGGNYRGDPSMVSNPLLRSMLLEHFGRDTAHWRRATFVPLGDRVAEALRFLAREGVIDGDQILDGLPHPSGANAERIGYFLGRKPRALLSRKTDPGKLDRARAQVVARVASLRLASFAPCAAV